MPATVELVGLTELTMRLDKLPANVREKLLQRITGLTTDLAARAQAAAPVKTGLLRSEITPHVYSDNPSRVAGYVEVVAPGVKGEYPKAAALEYGVNKARKIAQRAAGGKASARRTLAKEQIAMRVTRPVHMQAFRYLRRSFEAIRPEVEAELAAALAEAGGEFMS